jgi:small-conductance mechanosensitive channel
VSCIFVSSSLFTYVESFIYMWGALSFLADNMWESVDDILVGILVLSVGHLIAHGVQYILNGLLKYPRFIVDIITTSWRFFLFAVCLYQIIGVGAVQHFVGGFSIGIGYALQPYIISMFNGAALYGGGRIKRRARVKFSDEDKYVSVEYVGLFFTELKTDDNVSIFVANSKMIQDTLYVKS